MTASQHDAYWFSLSISALQCVHSHKQVSGKQTCQRPPRAHNAQHCGQSIYPARHTKPVCLATGKHAGAGRAQGCPLTSTVQHSDRSTYPGLGIYPCAGMQASTLVLAEHKDARLAPATLSTVTAATQLGAPVTLLVSGHGLDAVVQNARGVHGVGQVPPVSQPL